MLGMHPPFFQGVLVPLNMTNPVRFMTNPCLTNPLNGYQHADKLTTFAAAIHNKGAPLDNCWGFMMFVGL